MNKLDRHVFPAGAALAKSNIAARTVWTLDVSGAVACRCLKQTEALGRQPYALQWKLQGKWQKATTGGSSPSALLRAASKGIADKLAEVGK